MANLEGPGFHSGLEREGKRGLSASGSGKVPGPKDGSSLVRFQRLPRCEWCVTHFSHKRNGPRTSHLAVGSDREVEGRREKRPVRRHFPPWWLAVGWLLPVGSECQSAMAGSTPLDSDRGWLITLSVCPFRLGGRMNKPKNDLHAASLPFEFVYKSVNSIPTSRHFTAF